MNNSKSTGGGDRFLKVLVYICLVIGLLAVALLAVKLAFAIASAVLGIVSVLIVLAVIAMGIGVPVWYYMRTKDNGSGKKEE